MRQRQLEIEGNNITVRVFRERRRDIRYAFGRSALILRLPFFLSENEENQQIAQLRDWARMQFATHASLRGRFFKRQYQDGDRLQVGSRTYTIRLLTESRKTHSGAIASGHIQIRLSDREKPERMQDAVRRLTSRLVAADFLPEITRRVHELNHQHFGQPIERIYLKYNTSNWGSCSAGRNINLSTRLLFAPPEVIDYVIIHELAHLVELNHSDRYWRLVEAAMPDYMLKEKWLKENGHLCDF